MRKASGTTIFFMVSYGGGTPSNVFSLCGGAMRGRWAMWDGVGRETICEKYMRDDVWESAGLAKAPRCQIGWGGQGGAEGGGRNDVRSRHCARLLWGAPPIPPVDPEPFDTVLNSVRRCHGPIPYIFVPPFPWRISMGGEQASECPRMEKPRAKGSGSMERASVLFTSARPRRYRSRKDAAEGR